MENLKKNKKIIFIIMACVFIAGIVAFMYFNGKEGEVVNVESFLENGSDESNHQNNGSGYANGENNQNAQSEENIIFIHIIGEIQNEGLITLKEGARIVDAIEKAGGVTESADLSRLNLAFVLSDGQKVRIPSIHDSDENMAYVTDGSGNNVIIDNGNGTSGISMNNSKVNINTASQTELETLDGIGPSLAARIIEYRNKNGKFKSVEDLLNVSGIGEAKLDGMKGRVVVK